MELLAPQPSPREYFTCNRDKLFAKMGVYECGNCNAEHSLHIHHIVPLSQGGTNCITNLAVLCKDCHAKAHGGSELVARRKESSKLLTHNNLEYWRLDKEYPYSKIASMTGSPVSTISKACRQFGIPIVGKRETLDEVIEFFESMESGSKVTQKKLYSEILKVHRTTLAVVMKKDVLTQVMLDNGIYREGNSFKKD